jgi:hypothetical protein
VGFWSEAVEGFSTVSGAGSDPVAGRVGLAGAWGELAGGFNCDVGILSEPDGGNGAVPGLDGASPVERRSIAVGGRTGPLGVLAGVDGDRVTPAGGRMEPLASFAGPPGDPAAGNGAVGGLSDVVGGRGPVGEGGLKVRRIDPVAGRFEGRGGARGGVAGAGGAGWAGGMMELVERSVLERGKSVTRGTSGDVVKGEVGVTGRWGEGGTSSGMSGGEKG